MSAKHTHGRVLAGLIVGGVLLLSATVVTGCQPSRWYEKSVTQEFKAGGTVVARHYVRFKTNGSAISIITQSCKGVAWDQWISYSNEPGCSSKPIDGGRTRQVQWGFHYWPLIGNLDPTPLGSLLDIILGHHYCSFEISQSGKVTTYSDDCTETVKNIGYTSDLV